MKMPKRRGRPPKRKTTDAAEGPKSAGRKPGTKPPPAGTVVDGKTQLKTGPLSDEDKAFIRANSAKLTLDELQQSVLRSKTAINKFIRDEGLVTATMSQEQQHRLLLKSRLWESEFWRELRPKLFDNEVQFFEDQWISSILQFEQTAAVVHTENMQVVDLVMNRVLQNRVLQKYKDNEEQVKEFRNVLLKELQLAEDQRDNEMVKYYRSEISNLTAEQKNYDVTIQNYQKNIDNLSKALKATRDQRVKRIEDSRSSWAGFAKLLQEEHARMREGEEINVIRAAVDKEQQRLTEYHEYADGELDQPILTYETYKGR